VSSADDNYAWNSVGLRVRICYSELPQSGHKLSLNNVSLEHQVERRDVPRPRAPFRRHPLAGSLQRSLTRDQCLVACGTSNSG
jgi:hypothetical protein